MTTKHTPGPWTDDGHDGRDSLIIHSQWGEVARVGANGDTSQRDANARLIAAAPELLAALKRAEEELNRMQSCLTGRDQEIGWQECLSARAAISKATGQA
jgi:hypothetical protein